jgi:hypothetical protein
LRVLRLSDNAGNTFSAPGKASGELGEPPGHFQEAIP